MPPASRRLQRHDLALAGLGKRRGRAAYKGRVTIILPKRGAALRLPATGLQGQECLQRACHFRGRARDVETDGAMLGEAVALAAQLLQFLCAQRFMQQFIGVTGRIEAGAIVGLQYARLHAAVAQYVCKGLHRRTIERHDAQDQRVGAGLPRRLQQVRGRVPGKVAIERRCAKRAIRFGADENGQGNCRRATWKPPAGGQSVSQARSTRQARKHRCGPARKRPPPIPSRVNNSRSAQWCVGSARAIAARRFRQASAAHACACRRHPATMRDVPPLVQQSRVTSPIPLAI